MSYCRRCDFTDGCHCKLPPAPPTGWRCLSCGGCYAPTVEECKRCAPVAGGWRWWPPLNPYGSGSVTAKGNTFPYSHPLDGGDE